MRPHPAWSCALLLALAPHAFGTLQQKYLDAYLCLRDAAKLEKSGDPAGALKQYLTCSDDLKQLGADAPHWESKLLHDTAAVCEDHMRALPPNMGVKPAPVPPLFEGMPSDATAATLQEKYLDLYLDLNDFERKERDGKASDARAGFQDCYNRLRQLRADHPDWEAVLIVSRLEDCRAKLAELSPVVPVHPVAPVASTNSVASPAPSPSANATVTAAHAAPPVPFIESSYKRPQTISYPWKANIATTVFWIGDSTSGAKTWDPGSTLHNSGADDPDQMSYKSGYAYETHASTLNPFYVALPFNELAHPDEAAKWVPSTWAKPARDGKPVSSCQGRWVEIKNRSGRFCFAQWEDVGPSTGDDPEYVFGSKGPQNQNGLAVSPAVAKYLGLDGTSITSWHFVDDADVRPGMWLRYDEQAVLFTALHQLDGAQ